MGSYIVLYILQIVIAIKFTIYLIVGNYTLTVKNVDDRFTFFLPIHEVAVFSFPYFFQHHLSF